MVNWVLLQQRLNLGKSKAVEGDEQEVIVAMVGGTTFNIMGMIFCRFWYYIVKDIVVYFVSSDKLNKSAVERISGIITIFILIQ